MRPFLDFFFFFRGWEWGWGVDVNRLNTVIIRGLRLDFFLVKLSNKSEMLLLSNSVMSCFVYIVSHPDNHVIKNATPYLDETNWCFDCHMFRGETDSMTVRTSAKLIYPGLDLEKLYSVSISWNYRLGHLNLDGSFRQKFIFDNCRERNNDSVWYRRNPKSSANCITSKVSS